MKEPVASIFEVEYHARTASGTVKKSQEVGQQASQCEGVSSLVHLTTLQPKCKGKLCLQTYIKYVLYKYTIYHTFIHRSEKEMGWFFVEMQTFKWTSHIPSVVNECCSSPNGTKLMSLSSSLQKSSKFVWNPGCSLSDILPNISSACQHNSSAISFFLSCWRASAS